MLNRYRREWDKLDSVFSARRLVILVARTRWKKREENSVDILAKVACGQVSSPRLYRLSLWIARCTWAELKLDIDDLSNDEK